MPWIQPPSFPDWWSPNDGETYPKPVTLTFHDAGVTSDCAAQAGQDINGDDRLPGGFGWLEVEDTDDCDAAVYETNDPNGIGSGCSGSGRWWTTVCLRLEDRVDADRITCGSVVKIPYFNDIWTGPANGSGPCGKSGKCYHISGYGAFHVVGYKLSSGSNMSNFVFDPPVDPPEKKPGQLHPKSQWVKKFDCVPEAPGSNEVCLIGYFIEYTDSAGGTIGTGGRGITVIKLTG